MAGVNRWHGVGNLTDDPKLKQGDREDGSNDRCEFSIAINKPPGREGAEQPPTYLDMVCWGKLAGQVDKYATKGRLVYVEGEIEVRKWETDEGEKRKIFRIKAYVVRFLGSKKDEEGGGRRDRDDEPRRSRDRDEEPRRSRGDDMGASRREPRDRAEDFDDLPF